MFLPLEIPFPRIDPAAFTIPLPDMALGPIQLGAFPVRWYALGYIFGLLLGCVGEAVVDQRRGQPFFFIGANRCVHRWR